MGWIVAHWAIIGLGLGLTGLGIGLMAGGARLVAIGFGLLVAVAGAQGGCTPTHLSVDDSHRWVVRSSLGLTLADIPPETPRSLSTGQGQQTVHRDATRRLSAHTGQPTVDAVELNQRWVTVHVGEQAWSLPELTLADLGYDPFTNLAYLHHYQCIPTHTVVGGQVEFVGVPDHPLLKTLRPGDAVLAHDRGQWWPARVRAVNRTQGVQVRYDGYGPEWDAWLWPHRVTMPAGAGQKLQAPAVEP